MIKWTSDEELAEVIKTKRVWVIVCTSNAPPPIMALGVTPFKEG